MTTPKQLLALLLLPASLLCAETPTVIPLWANGAPGFENRRDEPEQARDYWVRHINNPSVTVFLPPPEKATGAAIVVAPGGGHRELVFQAEGVDTARFLNSLGVAAFVLKYRLGREEGSPYSVERDAAADGQRAMRLVRSRAAEWGIDPHRIGLMGFSAGGEVVSMVVYRPTAGDPNAADPVDRVSCRPDFQILIYPGPLGVPDVVPGNTPPAFLLGANDDDAPSRTIVTLLQKLRAAGVRTEAHLYARGGHAFNMGQRTILKTLKHWPDRLADWLADNNILDPNIPAVADPH
jgi:acetyl esterase/lipase